MRRIFFLTVLMLVMPVAAQAACTSIAVGTPLTFGNYMGVEAENTTTITVDCTLGFAYEIGIAAGTSGSTNARTMANGSYVLRYGMYQDSARGTNWGDIGGVDTVHGVGNGTSQIYTIYGTVPAGQLVAPGSYVDASLNAHVYGGPAGQLTIVALVTDTCTISSASLAFAPYSGAVDTSTSAITVTCTNTTPYEVGLSAGNAPGGSVTGRAMVLGANQTPYALYRDGAMTLNWGTSPGIDEVSGTGNGSAQTFTVYGRIAAGLYPRPGTYSDTIVATITY